jgi:thiol-disulfide isomerase/thioredoxin
MRTPPATPLEQTVTTPEGRSLKLSEWLEDRPVALIVWAAWCPPCMAEKQAQADLQARLITSGSRARIKSLQAYDDISLTEGQRRIARFGGGGLDIARASPGMEAALKAVFGQSPVDPARTSLPAQLLLAPGGAELGRSLGMLPSDGRMASYWSQRSTFELMDTLEALAQA